MSLKLAVVGGGIMGEAIISGCLRSEIAAPSDISVVEVVEGRRNVLSDRYSIIVSATTKSVIENADMVVIAIKPQDVTTLYRECNGLFHPGQTILSILAGTTISSLQEGFGHKEIVRSMPNTPGQIGRGVTVWYPTEAVSQANRGHVRRILEAFGPEHEVDNEKYLDMATALSGSGPAYVFLFLESLIDAGVSIGLPRTLATALAQQTLAGSAEFAVQANRHPAALRDDVTSPGGTTAAGVRALEREGFRTAILDAVWAAYDRSRALGS